MALAQHVPTGSASAHIKQSRGGDDDLLSFYCTSNQVAYSKPLSKFNPRTTQWEHHKSGFTSNTRAFLSYSTSMDEIDNPRLKSMLEHNYLTMTKKDFTPPVNPTGNERFPDVVGTRSSGFTEEDSNKLAIPRDYADKVFIDTRIKSTPASIGERHIPLLHKLRSRDPVAQENFGHGPVSKMSEYKSRYRGGDGEKKDLFPIDMGKQEVGGAAHNTSEMNPVTHSPRAAFVDTGLRNYLKPVGVSETKACYTTYKPPSGNEAFPDLVLEADRCSGHTRETGMFRSHGASMPDIDKIPDYTLERIKRGDPANYMYLTNPPGVSVSKVDYSAKAIHGEPSEAQRLGRVSVGDKELGGAVINNEKWSRYDPDGSLLGSHPEKGDSRFATTYKSTFLDMAPRGAEREGHVRGGVLPAMPDGFTKNTKFHNCKAEMTRDWEPSELLARTDAYQSRSMATRDPFLLDRK